VNRWVTAGLLVLLIQCGIVTLVFWPGQKPETESTEPVLAPFASETVDELRIGDEFDNEAVLVKSNDQWFLPGLEKMPADAMKVDALLKGIADQKTGWPVARSVAARQRFQVADHHYQKRLGFFSGGKKLGTIYLGTSPGFRKVHARNESQDAIYSITFNAFDAPAVSDAWLEPRLLQVRAPLNIEADLYSLNFGNGKWLSGTGRTPDERELEALTGALRTLQIDGVAEQDIQRDLSAAEADLVLRINSLAGEVTLELFTLNGQHFIHSSKYPLFFKLSAYDFDRLTGIDIRLVSGEETEQ